MSVLYSKFSSILAAFFLLLLTQVYSRVSEKPIIYANRTMMIADEGISHQNVTFNNTANISNIIDLTRVTKWPTMFLKNGYNSARKIDSYTLRGTSRSSIIQKMPWTQIVNPGNEEPTIANRRRNSTFANMVLSKRSGIRQKYPNHSSVYRNVGSDYDNGKFYTNNVDYEQYYSNGNYDTISENKNDWNNNNNNNEDSTTDPWRVSYNLPNMGYLLSPMSMNAVDEDRPVVTMLRECNCASRSTRSYECNKSSNNLFNLLSALGQNIWALMQLIINSSVPFFVTFIIFKLIIIPLKIFKLIKLIKFFIKFFVILPIFLRIIFPDFYNSFNIPNFLLQNILGIPLSYSDSRYSYSYRYGSNLNSLNNTISVLKKMNFFNSTDIWDVKACPSRLACEIGQLLSTLTDTYFLHKIVIYLLKETGRSYNNYDKNNSNDNGDDQMHKNEVFKVFLIALSKRWTKDKCEIYNCSVLF